MPDLKQSLRDFVATSNSGKYKTEGEVMSKFPELKGYDINVLRDFVATSNSGKYKTEDEVFAKFPEFKFSTPKKKVPTQVSKPSVGSSGTTETPQKQSSDSSRPDGIYKYQGNLKANYKKEDGQWYIDPTGGTKFQPLKQGDVAKRVKVLESQAKYDVDLTAYQMPNKVRDNVITLPGEDKAAVNAKYNKDKVDRSKAKVFTGFTGKEENKYRVVDGFWQRSTPNDQGEYSDWTTITNEGSIKALNSKFKQNASLDVVKTKEEYSKLGFKDINSNLIGGDEADAVPMLNKRYSNLGFKFEEGLGDQMIVRSSIPGVKPLTINMDSWDSEKDANNAAILKAYLSQNALTKEREKEVSFTEQYQNIALDRTGNTYVDETKRLADLEAGKLNIPETELQQGLNQQKKNEKIQQLEKETGLSMREIQDERARKAKIYGEAKVFKGDLTAAAIAEQNKVNKVYVNNEIKDINLRNKLSLRLSEQFDNDLADFKANYDTYTEEEITIKEADLKQKATELKQVYDQTKKDSSHIEYLLQSQAKSAIASKIVAEKTGTVAGAISRSLTDAIIDSGAGIYQGLGGLLFDTSPITTKERQAAKDAIAGVFTNTTSEFTASEDRSLMTSTLVALTQMAPAVAAGVATGGATAGAAYFWGIGYSNAYDSMEGLNIADDDKRKLSFAIATATAALETFGLTKITSNKVASNFVTKRVAQVLSGLPKEATMEMMNNAIYADMKKIVVDKLIKVGAKGAIEGGVEVSQSAAETAIKELYDTTRDKEVFTEDWGSFGKNALKEFLVGSFAGATVNSMSNLGTTVQQLSDPINFGLSKEIATDEDLQDLFKNDLKSKIIQGEISIPEAKAKLRAVGEFKALLGKVPSNLLEQNQQKAMTLIEEKQKLQREIEGKEPALVEKEKQRIADIDNEMKQIVEKDATDDVNITAIGLEQVPEEFRDKVRKIGTQKIGLLGKKQDIYRYTVTRDEYTKLQENAVQERSTEEVLPREQDQTGEAGSQREGMGQSIEGEEVAQEGVTEENPLSSVEATAKALNNDLVQQIQDESGQLFPLSLDEDQDVFNILSERYHEAKQNGNDPDLVNAFEKVLGDKQVAVENTTQDIDTIRAKEQAELIEALPNAEQYMTNGKVDENKITDPEELKTFNEIYDKYDEVLTPLIREAKIEEAPVVEEVTKEVGTKKPIENVELKLNVDSTTDGLKNFINEDNDVKEKEEYDIVRMLPDDKKPSFKIDKGVLRIRIPSQDFVGRSGGGTYINLKAPDGFDSEIFAEKLATIRHEKNRTDKEGKATAKVVEEVRQAIQDSLFELVETEQSTIDDVKTLDTTDATNLQKVLGFIESIENDLDNFGKGTLGMNLPVAVAKAVIKSIKVLLQAGVTLEQAIKQAAVDNNVTEQDIMDTMVAVQASQATQNKVRAKVTGQKAPKVSPAAKAAKAITKTTKTMVTFTVDEMEEYKKLIKKEIKDVNAGKKSVVNAIKTIADAIKMRVTKGQMDRMQLKYIMNKLAKVNFSKQESVDNFIDYVFKKMTDAEYLDKLSAINKINKAIKNSKNMVAEIKYLADMFTKIDLSQVTNIDKHLEIANKIKESLARYTKQTDPTGIEFRKNVDYQELYDYVSKNEDKLKTKIEKSLSEIYDKLFGSGASNGMSDEDMIDNINKAKADKVAEMRDIVEAKLEELKNTIDEDTPDVIKKAVSLDPKLIPMTDLIDIINGITMYMDNGILSGMKKIVAKYDGLEAANKSKVRFKQLVSILGKKASIGYNNWFGYVDSILTKKTARAGDVEQFKKESGNSDIELGYNKSQIERNKKENEYKKNFGKIKNFNRSNNIVERRIISHMQRELMDSEKQSEYFSDRKKLIESSIKNLKGSDDIQLVEEAKLLEESAIKLGVLNKDGSVNEGSTIDDINSKTEKFNVDAVKYIQDMFSDIYEALYDHSLGFYNTLLERDVNYTPDVIKGIKAVVPDKDAANKSDFSRFTGMLVKKAGVLMKTDRPSSLTDKYISLNFDQDMFSAYESALRDLYTSEYKQKFNAYRSSNAFKDIMGKDKNGISRDAKLVNQRYDAYVNVKEGNIAPDDDTDRAIKKFLNTIGVYNTAIALGSLKNILAQSIPTWIDTMVSTKSYLNPKRAGSVIIDSFNPQIWDFVERANSQVALRGKDAVRFTETVKDMMKKESFTGDVKKISGKILNFVPEQIIKITNQYPDKVAAIGTWMAYYREYCAKNKIPLDLENPNADAVNYAETKTKVQILPSDAAERGKIGTENSTGYAVARQMLFPFSSFAINSKNRIYGDLLRIFRGDTLNAANDMVGAIAGVTAFQMINHYWKIYVGGIIASALFGDDEDEEELAKRIKSSKANSLLQGIQDFVSPMPILDPLIPVLGNKIISAYDLGLPEEQQWNEFLEKKVTSLKKKQNKSYTDEEIEEMKVKFFKDNQFQFRDPSMMEYADKFGSLGISYKVSKELFDIYQSATTGVYMTEFNGKPVEKILPEAGKEKMKEILYAKIAGLTFTDINRQAQQAYYKVGKEMSLTATQAETADKIKEWSDFNGYKMDEYTYQAIKNESSLNKVKAAIRNMDGMSIKEKDEYIKSLKD